MELGIDIFLNGSLDSIKNKNVGLVTNLTGVNKQLDSTIDLLFNHPDIKLKALYGPEHGIRGDLKEGEEVKSSIDKKTKLPVYSLYGKTRKPTNEMLENIDVIIFDLQDIGSRYYTYIYTMAYVMEACGENHIEVIVLDRPNPISGIKREGNIVDEEYTSFVGLTPILNRHGLTIGELALLFKNEFNYECNLTVIPMKGWKRSMYYDETDLFWIPPSPNTTSIDMCILYTGTCLFEGTNVSEGRGTTQPFEITGAPYIDGMELAEKFNSRNLKGVVARPVSFKPTYQKYENELCYGVQLHVTDRSRIEPLKAVVYLISDIANLYPNSFKFREETKSGKSFFDLLAGNGRLRQQILEGTVSEYLNDVEKQTKKFEKFIQPYLLYKNI
jgi:uncharacterized protein YbbC (DUF1343 family)